MGLSATKSFHRKNLQRMAKLIEDLCFLQTKLTAGGGVSSPVTGLYSPLFSNIFLTNQSQFSYGASLGRVDINIKMVYGRNL